MSRADHATPLLPDGAPLECLFERPGLARDGWPPSIVEAYGGGFGLEVPSVIANFVTSVDGVVGLAEGAESGGIISGGAAADRFVMGLLRAAADVVLVGAGTFRKATTDSFSAEGIYPSARDAFAEARRTFGLAPAPRFALVTGSGDVDTAAPALASATIFTTAQGEARLRSRVAATTRVVALPGARLQLSDVVAHLRNEGARVILSEGGPSFFAQLVAARAVDELFVTTSPKLFGRTSGDGRRGLAEGLDLAGRRLELTSLRRHGSLLFSRYRVE
ncbi:MAG TPA: dihydrofolate reductase family protein [Polyangiaceae bacterium]|nr:dihydrofolate reductase family protein [Polyangiaceae bacterium]